LTQNNHAHTQLLPNKEDMRKHIEFIMSGMDDYKDGQIEIAYGDEQNNPNRANMFCIAGGDTLDEMVEFACKWNMQGRNIYIVDSYQSPSADPVNRGGSKHFYATNTFWVDIDNNGDTPITSSELKLKYAHCRPGAVIVTGTKPTLRTWALFKTMEPISNPAEVTEILNGLIQGLDGDAAAKDVTRLTRMAGCISWATGNKAKLGRVNEIVRMVITEEPPISVERLKSAYPIKHAAPKARITEGLNFSSFDRLSDAEIRYMLAFLTQYDGSRREWIDIGMALHDDGRDFELWNEWSSRSETKYNYNECVYQWNSFKTGKGITIGTLISMAKKSGYIKISDPPAPGDAIAEEAVEVKKPTPKDTGSSPTDINSFVNMNGVIGETIRDILDTSQMPHPELATLNTLAALGAVFGRRYASPLNTRTNLYTVGIAYTGAGKDHSRKYIKSLLRLADLGSYLGNDSFVSGAGLLRSIADKPSQIMHVDEFGMVLADIKNKNTGSHLKICAKILTEIYGTSSSFYLGATYADPKTKPVEINSPNLCLYGTSTMEKYIEALDRSVVSSGELNRYVIIKPENNYPERNFIECDSTPKQSVIDSWRSLAPMFGQNNPEVVPEITHVKWDWQKDRLRKMWKLQDSKIQINSIGALWSRYVENTIKIAMIIAIARNNIKPHIETEDLDAAEWLVKKSVEFMTDLATNHMYDSVFERDCNRVLDAIKRLGGKDVKKERVGDLIRDLDSASRNRVLETLEERGSISISQANTGIGRHRIVINVL